MDDAAADSKCEFDRSDEPACTHSRDEQEYVAVLSSGSIVIGSHCLLPFANETPSVGIAFPRPLHELIISRNLGDDD
jgi:hypothetical protein